MINLEKAEIYAKYQGDIDVWLRFASADEKSLFSEGDWGLIESVVEDLSLSKARRKTERSKSIPQERTFRPATNEEYEAASKEANRFRGIVVDYEYEAVINELWKLA